MKQHEIIDNLWAHYWNMGPENEQGAQEQTGGPGELNSSPTLEIIL